jgi:pyrroloquinoline quinone biosynthesis protein D
MADGTFGASAHLRLARRARLKHDAVRGSHVLLVPEAVLELNAQAVEVVALCDGTRTEADIVRVMSERHPAPEVARDVAAFVLRLRQRGLLELV